MAVLVVAAVLETVLVVAAEMEIHPQRHPHKEIMVVQEEAAHFRGVAEAVVALAGQEEQERQPLELVALLAVAITAEQVQPTPQGAGAALINLEAREALA
jgi:hypothetical protein